MPPSLAAQQPLCVMRLFNPAVFSAYLGLLMDIPHKKTDKGFTIEVKVQPRSSQKGIAGVEGAVVKVKLTFPPVDGEANKQLIEVLAKHFKVPKGRVRIIRGETSRLKLVEIVE